VQPGDARRRSVVVVGAACSCRAVGARAAERRAQGPGGRDPGAGASSGAGPRPGAHARACSGSSAGTHARARACSSAGAGARATADASACSAGAHTSAAAGAYAAARRNQRQDTLIRRKNRALWLQKIKRSGETQRFRYTTPKNPGISTHTKKKLFWSMNRGWPAAIGPTGSVYFGRRGRRPRTTARHAALARKRRCFKLADQKIYFRRPLFSHGQRGTPATI
jgi:hypothetical protein